MKVGIDSVELDRFEKSLSINGFAKRFFSEKELTMLSTRQTERRYIESAAANFAVKEAFSKSLGIGVRDFSLNEISVLRDSLGAPYIELDGRAKIAAKNYSFTVSITHTQTTATAIVIAF